ncbi:MAG: PAS domain S-box protein [Verrucomicrobiia bacterium]
MQDRIEISEDTLIPIRNLKTPILLIDPEGVIKHANPAAVRLFESKSDCLLTGRKLLEFVRAADLPALQRCISDSLNRKCLENILLRMRIANGNYNTFFADFVRFSVNSSTTIAVLFEPLKLCRTIKTHSVLSVDCPLMELLPDSIFLLDENGRIEYMNRVSAANFKKSPEELIGHSQFDLFPPEVAQKNLERIKRVIETATPIREQVYVPVAGETHWVDKYMFPIFDSNGRAKWVLGIGRNLTAIKEAESKMADTFRLHEALIGTSSVGFCAYEASGQCIFANDALCEYIGGKKEDVLKQNFRELKSWRDSGMLEMAEKALSENRPIEGEVFITTTFGKQVWFKCRFVPYLRDGKKHLLLMAVDISNWKKSEKMLKIQRDVAVGIGSGFELKTMLSLILDSIIQLEGVDCGGIYLLNSITNKYELTHSNNAVLGGYAIPTEIDFEAEYWKQFRSREALYLAMGEIPEHFLRSGIKCMAVIPVFEGTVATALIIVVLRNLTALPEQTKVMLETIAAQISGALAGAKATEELRNSESFLKAVYETSVIMHAVCEQKSGGMFCIMCNKAFAEFFNKSPTALIGSNIEDLFGRKEWKDFFEQCKDVRNKNIVNVEKKYVINGKAFWLLVSCYYLGQSYFKNPSYALAMVDITQRKEAEMAMLQISSKIYEAQEKERKHISRELHDGCGQMLVSVTYQLSLLQRELASKNPQATKTVEKCRETITKIIDELRLISHKLRPSSLDDFGFISACEGLCNEISQNHDLIIELRIDRDYDLLSAECQLHIYRIIQELLNNTVRHSRATKVKLSMNRNESKYIIEYSDNGFGMDMSKLSDNENSGLGLINIRERVFLMNGSIEIGSGVGKGFSARIFIPASGSEEM